MESPPYGLVVHLGLTSLAQFAVKKSFPEIVKDRVQQPESVSASILAEQHLQSVTAHEKLVARIIRTIVESCTSGMHLWRVV